jgi:phosphohistidine swiveling domain-containing protein
MTNLEEASRPAASLGDAERWLPALLVLFVGSGCAALVYEVVWFQLLQLSIGSSAVSLGVLLGIFMGGMCLGSLLLPRYIDARHHPLRVYAYLELGIGLFGVVVLYAVPVLGNAYTAVAGTGQVSLVLRALVAATQERHDRVGMWIERAHQHVQVAIVVRNARLGIGASPGVISGRARVIYDVRELPSVRDGEILVTRQTDPAWSTVFARISGLVLETGGVLAHGASLCREFNLPCVTAASTLDIAGGSATAEKIGGPVEIRGRNARIELRDVAGAEIMGSR